MLRGDHSVRAQIARSPIKTLRSLGRTIDSLAGEIRDAVNTTGISPRDIDGVGDLVAADIGTETGNPTRFGTKAAFAMANGTAPVEASPDASNAIASTEAATTSPTKPSTPTPSLRSPAGTDRRNYYERCLSRGKTKREAIPNLKRCISHRIWTRLNTGPLT